MASLPFYTYTIHEYAELDPLTQRLRVGDFIAFVPENQTGCVYYKIVQGSDGVHRQWIGDYDIDPQEEMAPDAYFHLNHLNHQNHQNPMEYKEAPPPTRFTH